MPVHWIRALHRELGRETVMPADAVQHSPGWEAVGEPSTDGDALRRALEAEQAAEAALAAEARAEPPSSAPLSPPAPRTSTSTPEPATPRGDAPKEQ